MSTAEEDKEHEDFIRRWDDIYSQAIALMQMRRGKRYACNLAVAAAMAGARYIAEVHPAAWDSFIRCLEHFRPDPPAQAKAALGNG